MRTLFLAVLTLGPGAIACAQERQIDAENLFPNVGATIVFVDPNPAGIPPGVLQAGGAATLIDDRVVLTAGHFARVSEDGVPPFIHVYVSFSLHIFDDRNTWIPVVRQAWHPSTLPCHNLTCDTWPDPPLPHFFDVGLLFLERSPKGIKPAKFAKAGTIEAGGGGEGQIMVGYGPLGSPNPVSPTDVVRRFRLIPGPYQVFDEATAIGSAGETCLGDSSSPTFLAPLPESGRKRRPMVAISGAFEPPNCRTGRSFLARLDNDDLQVWIADEIKKFRATQR